MLALIRRYAALYLLEILGFCLMGNHFHILVRVFTEDKFTDEDILKRYVDFYGDERIFTEGLVPSLRLKLSSLSEFRREIKVGFARFYNRRHDRRGYFWGDRFKSVIVENGVTLINCLAYIDLNPLRAGLRKATSKSLKIRFWKRSAAENLNSAKAIYTFLTLSLNFKQEFILCNLYQFEI
jgi:REP element-mobilizing transposase RayT